MKVLHIGKYYYPFSGGVELVNQNICELLQRNGVDVEVLAHNHKLFKTEKEVVNHVPVTLSLIIGRLLFVPLAPWFPFDLWKALQKKPDVIHIHMPNLSAFWCLFFPSARKAKWIVHWHGDVLDEHAPLALRICYPLYRLFEKALLRNSSVVVTTSPDYALHSPALADVQSKIKVIPLSLPDLSEQACSIPVLKEGKSQVSLEVLTVARLSFFKGHRVMLQALRILKERNINIQWTVIGNGEEEIPLKQLTKSYEIEDMVTFQGEVRGVELLKEYSSCDVFCLPSINRMESFGIVLLEAMRAGRPCISTNAKGSGTNWVVQDEITGVVVPASDAQSLAEALEDAARNPEKWQRYGKAGRLRFMNEFNDLATEHKWLELYKEVGSG